jgi:hypothetical protein
MTKEKRSCSKCIHWVDATAECSVAMRYDVNGWEFPKSLEEALDKDKSQANDCEAFST